MKFFSNPSHLVPPSLVHIHLISGHLKMERVIFLIKMLFWIHTFLKTYFLKLASRLDVSKLVIQFGDLHTIKIERMG